MEHWNMQAVLKTARRIDFEKNIYAWRRVNPQSNVFYQPI